MMFLSNRSHPRSGGHFPESVDDLQRIPDRRVVGFSRPIRLGDGNRSYIFKKSNPSDGFDLARSEVVADNFYRAMGVPVPPSRFYTKGKRRGRVSEFVDGSQRLFDWMRTASPEEKEAMRRKIARHVHVDCLLGNADLHGANIVVDRHGTPYRVDNGMAFSTNPWNDLSDLGEGVTHPGMSQYWFDGNPIYSGRNRLANLLRKIRDTDWTPGLKAIPLEQQRFIKKRLDMVSKAADYVDDLVRRGYDRGTVQRLLYKLVGPSKEQRKVMADEFREHIERQRRNGR